MMKLWTNCPLLELNLFRVMGTPYNCRLGDRGLELGAVVTVDSFGITDKPSLWIDNAERGCSRVWEPLNCIVKLIYEV